MEILRPVWSFVSWHRRAFAALSAALCVAGIVAAVQAPPPPGKPVVTLARAVTPGTELTAEDLTTADVPDALLTPGMARSPDDVVGAQAAIGLEPGQVVSESMLLRAGTSAEGMSLVPIAINDPELRALLAPGANVSLIVAFGESPEVLTAARIATMPGEADGTVASARSGTGMVVVEVPKELAPTVATLGQGGQLAVVLG